MNKTVAFVGVIGIVVVGLIGTGVLIGLGVDAGPFINLFSTTLPITITAGVTFYGLEKIKSQNVKIARNTNGNTSKLLSLIKREQLTPDEAMEVARIENDNRDLIESVDGRHEA